MRQHFQPALARKRNPHRSATKAAREGVELAVNQRPIGCAVAASEQAIQHHAVLFARQARHHDRLHAITEQIIRLEEDTDNLNHAGIKALFKRHRSGNAMDYIVGIEVFNHLERVMDRFEDVAHRISGIVIEQL